MKSSKNMTIAFLLNFSFAIIEFIFGLLFHSSAVLADAVHDTGDALAIGLSTLFENISTKKEDREYTLGYKRYSLLGSLLTSVILLVGSILVIVENIPKLFAPEKVNYDGMLVLGLSPLSSIQQPAELSAMDTVIMNRFSACIFLRIFWAG